MAELSIATYNLHGINTGLSMLTDLLTTTDIVCVQEHWLWCTKLHMLDMIDLILE